MPIIRNLNEVDPRWPNPVLTIGNFDGVHLGHQALFDLVKRRAAAIHGTSMVMTFDPHPLRVLTKLKGPPLITLPDHKLELIESTGIDVVICLKFTRELAAVEPEDFVKDLLVGRLGMREIVIGYDYTFGRQARGNRDLLIAMGRDLHFQVHTVSARPGPNGEIISSTSIRKLVRSGQVDKVASYLGRNYRLLGRVVRGQDRGGKLLGFPTANLKLEDELVPKIGVYAVRMSFGGRIYNGVANIGYNPTFGDVGLSVEVHCFDLELDIYDQWVKVDFVARIRDERKFSGPEELIGQIKSDCQFARGLLESNSDNFLSGRWA